MSVYHAPSIKTRTGPRKTHPYAWYATCDPCGWEGPDRRNRHEADSDVMAHLHGEKPTGFWHPEEPPEEPDAT